MLLHGSKTECPICHKFVAVLKTHSRIHDKAKCPICGKTTSKDSLTVHIKSHEKKRRPVENVSSYSKMVDDLTKKGNEGLRHEETQTCCLCQKKFAHRACLKSHIQTLHCKVETFCDLCPKTFLSKRNLIHHMTSVHLRKKFACNICDYRTAVKNHFRSHKMIHAAKVKCPICKKKVARLEEHMRCHNKPKTKHKGKHYCDLCPCTFAVRSEIVIHMKKDHLKLRPFECQLCVFKSYRKQNLDSHLLRHKPAKECKICHKTATNMKEHLRNHVEAKCPDLTAHIKAQHK